MSVDKREMGKVVSKKETKRNIPPEIMAKVLDFVPAKALSEMVANNKALYSYIAHASYNQRHLLNSVNPVSITLYNQYMNQLQQRLSLTSLFKALTLKQKKNMVARRGLVLGAIYSAIAIFLSARLIHITVKSDIYSDFKSVKFGKWLFPVFFLMMLVHLGAKLVRAKNKFSRNMVSVYEGDFVASIKSLPHLIRLCDEVLGLLSAYQFIFDEVNVPNTNSPQRTNVEMESHSEYMSRQLTKLKADIDEHQEVSLEDFSKMFLKLHDIQVGTVKALRDKRSMKALIEGGLFYKPKLVKDDLAYKPYVPPSPEHLTHTGP